MANRSKDDGPVESSFDFTKFLDYDDDETQVPGSDYEVIPFSRSEIVTGELDSDLEGAVETYIRAGKVSRGAKKALRRLAAENSGLEEELRELDAAVLERADSYDGLVSGILKEKNRISGTSFLDDSDPYDSKPVSLDEAPGSREARSESNELFEEIEKLEVHRSEINARRIELMDELLTLADKQQNGAWEYLDDLAGEKQKAAGRVEDITKVDFSDEDEEEFDKGVDELNDFIQGDFDPLAEDDEDEDEPEAVSHYEDQPLSEDGHTEQEILAMEEANTQSSVERPKSFSELFQVSSREDHEESQAPSGFQDAFSSSESQEDLHRALGDDGFDPDLDDGTGESSTFPWEIDAQDEDLSEESTTGEDSLTETPVDESTENDSEEAVLGSEVDLADEEFSEDRSEAVAVADIDREADSEDVSEATADDLSAEDFEAVSSDGAAEVDAEGAAWDESEGAEDASDELDSEEIEEELQEEIASDFDETEEEASVADEFDTWTPADEEEFSEEEFQELSAGDSGSGSSEGSDPSEEIENVEDHEEAGTDSYIGNLVPIYAGTPIFDALKEKYGISI